MARSRLGGTRRQLTGALGDYVYYSSRGSDGGYVQCVAGKPACRKYSNSDLQARNRMIMGQIERMFHILPTIISSGFVGVDSGTMSFQHFSRLNYPLLKRDFEQHFDDTPQFDWRGKRDMSAPAGVWQLTDGELMGMVFDDAVFSVGERNGVQFLMEHVSPEVSVSNMLARMNICPGDSLVLFLFRKDYPGLVPFVQTSIFKVADDIDFTRPVAEFLEGDIISPADDSLSNAGWDMIRQQFYIWWEDANSLQSYEVDCFAWMVGRFVGHRFLHSSAIFQWVDESSAIKYHRNCAADVFPSWKVQ